MCYTVALKHWDPCSRTASAHRPQSALPVGCGRRVALAAARAAFKVPDGKTINWPFSRAALGRAEPGRRYSRGALAPCAPRAAQRALPVSERPPPPPTAAHSLSPHRSATAARSAHSRKKKWQLCAPGTLGVGRSRMLHLDVLTNTEGSPRDSVHVHVVRRGGGGRTRGRAS